MNFPGPDEEEQRGGGPVAAFLGGITARQALAGAHNLAEAITGRPRRHVVPHPLGWAVTHEDGWTTTDEALAHAVADHLNRVAPLPCPHNGDWLEVTRLGSPEPEWLCAGCGHIRSGEHP